MAAAVSFLKKTDNLLADRRLETGYTKVDCLTYADDVGENTFHNAAQDAASGLETSHIDSDP
jgi:hypothetical protein